MPFVLDRFASARIAGFASTLVLPLSWYLVEVLIQRLTPYGSWSSLGYTQMEHGLLTPLAAWLGVAGVAFATVWIASAASWFVMSPAPPRSRAIRLSLWAVAFAACLWMVNLRPVDAPGSTEPLTVAAITPEHQVTQDLDRAMWAVMQSGTTHPEALERIDTLASELNSALMMRSHEAARAGARLVVWSETAGRVLASREQDLISRGRQFARDESVYLFMGLGVWHPGERPPFENKVVALTPGGDVAWQYRKARPIVGAEAHLVAPRHDDLPTLDTPFGRIGLVICHDLDFAGYVAQAGRKQVELLLAPSADWPVIADLHAKMGVMRAVENGFWLLRPAHAGLSVIASPAGRVTTSAYDTELEARRFSGRILVARARTVYPYIGSYLPLLATGLLAGLLVLAWRRDESSSRPRGSRRRAGG